MKQDRIQDLKRFEEQIFDVLQEYIDNKEDYPNDAVLIVRNSNHEVSIDSQDEFPKCTTYEIENYLRSDDAGDIEPDIDAVNELASKYFFVR